jgi:type VI secretion system protein ImpH
MDSQARSPASALEAITQIARSPFGAGFFGALSALMADSARGKGSPLSRPQRRPEDLWRILEEAGPRLDLFAAMRLIAGTFRDQPPLGTARRISEDPARFGQEVSLAFATRTVARIVPPEDGRAGKIYQLAIGLFGPNGALPNHLTEFAFDRIHHSGDRSLAAFADIFHHRALTLLYRAWAVNQPVVGLDRIGGDQFGDIVSAICGLGMPALQRRDGVMDVAKLAHAGLFARHTRNPEGLKALLVNYFCVDVQVFSWLGYWMKIPTDQQTRLGADNGFAVLGVESIAGASVWDVQTSFRIVVGPLTHARYLDFLPIGESLVRMISLIKLYVGNDFRFEIQLVLQNKEVPLSWLGNDVRLGWTSWLGVRVTDTDARDYVAIL